MTRQDVRDAGDTEFHEYLETAYPEHLRRIAEERASAKLVRFTYPIVGFLISFAVMGGLTLLVSILSRHGVQWDGREIPALEKARPAIQMAVTVMWGATAVAVVTAVAFCISAGLSQARSLLFSAEKMEMAARTEFYLRSVSVGPWTRRVENREVHLSAELSRTRSQDASDHEPPELEIEPRL